MRIGVTGSAEMRCPFFFANRSAPAGNPWPMQPSFIFLPDFTLSFHMLCGISATPATHLQNHTPGMLKTAISQLEITAANRYGQFMMRISRLPLKIGHLAAIAMAVIIISAPKAVADDPKPLGEHGDWRTYSFTEKGSKTCYALGQPKETLPKNVNRDPVYFLITNRQKPRVVNEVSVITGYPYKKNSTTTTQIGSDKFNMYTKDDGAWIDGAALQKRMIAAMKRGSTMIIKGISWRGTVTTDTYSLNGTTAAIEQIDDACK